MTEQLLIIDTSNMLNNPTMQGNFNDVTVNFDIPLSLPDSAKISLAHAVLYYTWHNITTFLGNNTFDISNDAGVTWITVTIPNGNYTIITLQATMRTLIFNQFATNGTLTLTGENHTGRIIITIANNIRLRLNNVGFRNLLGFSATQNNIITNTSTGDNFANFMVNRFSYLIHTDMINETIVNNTSHRQVIHSFSIDNDDEPNGPIIIDPFTKYYLTVKPQSSFRRVRFWLTDNNNTPINTGLPMVLTFHIKY